MRSGQEMWEAVWVHDHRDKVKKCEKQCEWCLCRCEQQQQQKTASSSLTLKTHSVIMVTCQQQQNGRRGWGGG